MRRVILCLALAACSGGASDGGNGDVPDAPGGGSAGDASGSGGTDRRLYPLEEGRIWTYDVTSTYTSCPAGRRSLRVLSRSTTDGRATFRVAGYCGAVVETSLEGDRVETYYDWGPRGWYRYLDGTVADQHTWTTTNGSATFTQTYHAEGGVAGSHTGCWKVVQNVSYTSYWIHCEGVGLVFAEMIDLGGGVIRAKLVDTNF
jgi:hypothetical protein